MLALNRKSGRHNGGPSVATALDSTAHMHFVQHVLCWTKPLAAQLVIIIVTPSTQHYCPQKQRNVLGDSGELNSKDHLHSKLALLGWEAAATVHSTTKLPSCNRSNCLPLNCLHSQSNKFNCLPFPSPFFPGLHAIAQINCANWFSSVYPLFFLSLTHSKLQLTLLHFPLPTSIEVGFFLFCLSVCLVQLSVLLCVYLSFSCSLVVLIIQLHTLLVDSIAFWSTHSRIVYSWNCTVSNSPVFSVPWQPAGSL